MSDNLESLLKLDSKIDRICNGMDTMKEKQDQMADDISKIKEAVYNPEEGLYARIRELESWKKTSTKLIWTLVTSTIGVIGALILRNFP
tara:strand:- start:203 stop:469 length:267 start_codon:yes stop_codon:yes gene_type:complete